jgi:hypothetical protein
MESLSKAVFPKARSEVPVGGTRNEAGVVGLPVGLATVIRAVVAVVRSVDGIVAVNVDALMYCVVRLVVWPLTVHLTVAPLTKLEPETVRLTVAPFCGAEVGLIEVIVGAGAVMVKGVDADGRPPGFAAVIWAVPTVVSNVAGIVADKLNELMTCVERFVV